jgi:outer membrane protein assembly factor BamB
VYKPENVKGEWRSAGHLSSPIVYMTQSAAVLENGNLLVKNGEKKQKIPQGFSLLNVSDGWIITRNTLNDLELIPQDRTGEHVVLELKRTVAACSIQGDVIAILFANNEMALYSLSTKKMTFKETSNAPVAVDARIVNPYFLKDLVVFSTLDGKVVIVNENTKKLLRSIIVGSEDYFNNITYLSMVENNLIASTGSSVLALSQKEAREKYDVRDIVSNSDGIWLTTKQGEVVALSSSLQYKGKKKFPFAHFVGLSVKSDHVYAVEQGGYMIALSKDLLSADVYDIDMKHEAIFVGDDRFYFSDRYIDIK